MEAGSLARDRGIRVQTDVQTQAASDSRAASSRAASFRAASLAAGAELAACGAGSGSRGSGPEVVRRSRRAAAPGAARSRAATLPSLRKVAHRSASKGLAGKNAKKVHFPHPKKTTSHIAQGEMVRPGLLNRPMLYLRFISFETLQKR